MKREYNSLISKAKKPRYDDSFSDELAQYGLLTQFGSSPLNAENKADSGAQGIAASKDEIMPEQQQQQENDDIYPSVENEIEPIPYTHQPPPPLPIANMTTPYAFDAHYGYTAQPSYPAMTPVGMPPGPLPQYGFPPGSAPPPPPPAGPFGHSPHTFRPPPPFPQANYSAPPPFPQASYPAPPRPVVSAINSMMPPTSTLNDSPNRTIFLGNVKEDITSHDILQCVHQGALEAFRLSKERYCAFLTFLDARAANAFYQTYSTKKFVVKDAVLQVGWGQPKTISPTLKLQIEAGATRNVYLGRLTDADTEEKIQERLKKFGPIEHIRLIKAQKIAFVHFLSILSAIKCNSVLPSEPDWQGKAVGYGRDHCTDVFVQYNSALGISPQKLHKPESEITYEPVAGDENLHNVSRTLYFGNIHPDAGVEDLCNVIKGGNILQIRFFKATQNAFVTFFDGESAERVYKFFEKYCPSVRGRKLKLGWGKPTSISPRTAFAIKNGASRNIYIGGLDTKIYTPEKLRHDFSDYGETEQVNILDNHSTAFVNFLSLNDAMTAIVAIKTKPEYADLKISYGKDRCGNRPKITKAMEMKAAKRLQSKNAKEGQKKEGQKKEGQKKEGENKGEEKKEGEKTECEKKDEEKKDEEKKDEEKKVKEKSECEKEKKEDEKKENEKKENEKKDEEKKEDEKKDEENKDEENKDEEKKVQEKSECEKKDEEKKEEKPEDEKVEEEKNTVRSRRSKKTKSG